LDSHGPASFGLADVALKTYRSSASLVLLAASIALGGCSAARYPRDLGLVFLDVTPMDYARILCRRTPMLERHTCISMVIEHYRATWARDLSPSEVTAGPFVALIGERFYRGRYRSDPFTAAFTVADGARVCRGRYSAFAGDTSPVFRVRCDDGRRGRAQIVLDQTGANGLGRIEMDDGSKGDIVFGYAAVMEDFR
jgi:hypothetical protein